MVVSSLVRGAFIGRLCSMKSRRMKCRAQGVVRLARVIRDNLRPRSNPEWPVRLKVTGWNRP